VVFTKDKAALSKWWLVADLIPSTTPAMIPAEIAAAATKPMVATNTRRILAVAFNLLNAFK